MPDTDQRFDELKRKFSVALRLLEGSRISLQNLNIQDNKLLIRAAVPTEEVRAELMSALERIDPSFDEVFADIRVDGQSNVPNTGQSKVQSDLEFSGN